MNAKKKSCTKQTRKQQQQTAVKKHFHRSIALVVSLL